MGSIQKFDILKPLDPRELRQLDEIAVIREYQTGELVFQEESRANHILLIESGLVEMVPKDFAPPVPIAKFNRGNIAGEELLFAKNSPPMSIMVEQDSSIYLLPVRELKYLFKYNHKTMLKYFFIFSTSLSDKIRKANATLFVLMKDNVLRSAELDKRQHKHIPCKETLGHDIPKVDQGIIDRLRKIGSMKSAQHNELVFREGDAGDHMYLIDTGEIRIFRTLKSGVEETLASLGPGDFFGEMAFVDDLPRSASAQVTTGSAELIVVPRRVMKKILNWGPTPGFNFLGSLCKILSFRLNCTIHRIYQTAGYPPVDESPT